MLLDQFVNMMHRLGSGGWVLLALLALSLLCFSGLYFAWNAMLSLETTTAIGLWYSVLCAGNSVVLYGAWVGAWMSAISAGIIALRLLLHPLSTWGALTPVTDRLPHVPAHPDAGQLWPIDDVRYVVPSEAGWLHRLDGRCRLRALRRALAVDRTGHPVMGSRDGGAGFPTRRPAVARR